jgi:hypothetical protein
MDPRSGPEEFFDSEIRERRKKLKKVLKREVMKGVAHNYSTWLHRRGNPITES